MVRAPGYLFDTNIVSCLWNPKKDGHRSVADHIDRLGESSYQFISAITVGELEFGVSLGELRKPGQSLSEAKGVLTTLKKHRGRNILPVTDKTGHFYGRIKARLADHLIGGANAPKFVEDWCERVGGRDLQLDENDLWIAACAAERGLTLLTHDKGLGRLQRYTSGLVTVSRL